MNFDLKGLKNGNGKLLEQNEELRKMMALMQENLELRYALKNHEINDLKLSPTVHIGTSKGHHSEHGVAACLDGAHRRRSKEGHEHAGHRNVKMHLGADVWETNHGEIPSSRTSLQREVYQYCSPLRSSDDLHLPGSNNMADGLTAIDKALKHFHFQNSMCNCDKTEE